MTPTPVPNDGELELLWERPEACLAKCGDALVALQLTSLQVDWLPALEAAFLRAADDAHGPLPLVSIFRLDRRYPLDLGFDGRLDAFKATFDATRHTMSACAVVLEFGGWVRTAMVRALGVMGVGGSRTPPFRVHASTAEALTWLAPHLDPRLPAGFYLDGIHDLKRRWGCEGP